MEIHSLANSEATTLKPSTTQKREHVLLGQPVPNFIPLQDTT